MESNVFALGSGEGAQHSEIPYALGQELPQDMVVTHLAAGQAETQPIRRQNT